MAISKLGNYYEPLGQGTVDAVKSGGGIDAVLIGGYEPYVAAQSKTYTDAQYRLDQTNRRLADSVRGTNWEGMSPVGIQNQRQRDELLGSWDPEAGTYAGYDPNKTTDYSEIYGGYGSEAERRAAAGMDDQGYLLPGFTRIRRAPSPYAGMTQDAARKAAFLKDFPTATKEQYQAFLADNTHNAGPGYRGFDVNALGSPNWGTMSFADPTRYSNPATARPASLGTAAPFTYGAMTLPSAPAAMTQPARNKTTEQAPLGDSGYTDPYGILQYLRPEVRAKALASPDMLRSGAGMELSPELSELWNSTAYNDTPLGLVDPARRAEIMQGREYGKKYLPLTGSLASNEGEWQEGYKNTFRDAVWDDRFGLLVPTAGLRNYAKETGMSPEQMAMLAAIAVGGAIAAPASAGGAGGLGAAGTSTTLADMVASGTAFPAATAGTAAGAGSLGSGLTLPGAAPTSIAPGTLGSGLTIPGATTTSIAPGALGGGLTAPSVLGPTFAAETLVPGAAAATLPGYTPSYDIFEGMDFGGQGLNPTSTTGLTAPTSPSLGSMGGGTGLTVGTDAGVLSAGGLTPAGISAAPTSLVNDASNYLSNPYTANPDPYTPPSSLPNVLNNLPPGLQELGTKVFDKSTAPLLTNLIQTLFDPGGSGGDVGGLVDIGNTPSGSNTPDPSTGLDDPNAYLPYGIGWRGMKGDKARKREKRGDGATAADPNYDESQAGVMKIGPTKVRAVRQHKKPERQYG